jgi:5,10-methylenetetrahydromethanopterin reductase
MTGPAIGVGLFGTEPAPRMVQLVEHAERLGYHRCWIGDSQNIWRETYTLLGAAAGRTSRIGLGTGVTNAVTRHLSVLASGWATLAELAPGRVHLGIGTGDSSLRTMGMHPIKLAELEERIGRLRRLFAGQEVTDDDTGAAYHLKWAASGTAVPVYVAASAPRILELSGRVADGVIMLVGTDPRFVTAALERVEAGARQSGRTLDDLDIILWTPTSIDQDGGTARDLVRAHVARVLIRPLPAELDPATTKRIDAIRESYDYYKHMETAADHADLVPDDLVGSFALAGTVDDCRIQYQRLAQLPLDEICIVPYTTSDTDRGGLLERFARQVASVPTATG